MPATPTPGSIQTDAQGRRFIMSGTRKIYISPAAFGEDIGGNAESSWHSGPQWNQYTGQAENPYKWGKLLTTATAAGIGAGALSAGGAFGGAAGGGGAGSSLGGLYGAPTAITSQGVSAGLGGMGGSMAGLSWLDAAMLGGDLFGKLFGASKAAGASDRAAAIQAEAAREALAEARRQHEYDTAEDRRRYDQGFGEDTRRYETRRTDMAPYRDVGQANLTRMSDLVANTPSRSMPASVQARLGPTSMQQIGGGPTPLGSGRPLPSPVPTMMPPPPGVSTGRVRVQAPTGEIRDVSAQEADGWIRLGAKRVG